MLLLWIIYVISVLFSLCLRARLFIDVLWSPAGKGLISWPSFVMSNCEVVTFPLVFCLIVSISDPCPLPYFYIRFAMHIYHNANVQTGALTSVDSDDL